MFMTTSLIKSLPSYSVQESTSDPLPVSEGLGAGLRIPTTKFINVIEWPVLDTHTNIVYKMFMFETFVQIIKKSCLLYPIVQNQRTFCNIEQSYSSISL